MSSFTSISDVLGSLRKNEPDREACCKTHGNYVARHIIMNIFTQCPQCSIEAAAQEEAEKIAAEKAHKRALWQKRVGVAEIPARFANRTLKRFVAQTEAQHYALQFATDFASEFKDAAHSGRCALFIGEPGTGKTHLACGIALRAINFGATALFTSVSKMNRQIRESKSFKSEKSETDVIQFFASPDLLIVDEVGIQSGTDSEARALFDVINERYEQCKPTIFISNLDVDGVKAALGLRIFDRLKEDGGEVVIFDWSSHRGSV